jgi:hypothetical protein
MTQPSANSLAAAYQDHLLVFAIQRSTRMMTLTAKNIVCGKLLARTVNI